MDIYILYIQFFKTRGVVGDDFDRGNDVFPLDSCVNTQIH
jgi:hypothetical protein